MARTLLTGATGFIGAHLARALSRRGDDVRVTVRDGSDIRPIEDLDLELVSCDVLDRKAVRSALKGVDRVFHAAGMTSMRPDDGERMFDVNVGGARVVLEECLRAEVERVVFTSSAAALGPARHGSTADESQLFTAAHLGIPYVTSVHEAEGQAMRLAAAGLPLVCVNPTVALGPGDLHVTSTRLVRSFMLGRVPAYADGAVNVVDVRDVAAGALLADAHGRVGERYILGGRNFTFDRLFADLGRLTGITPPVKVPRVLAAATAGVLGFGPGRTVLSAQEVAAASRYWTYRSAKAQRELGWSARPHEDTLEATVAWYMDREGDRITRSRRSQQLQYRAAGALIAAGEGTLGAGRRMLNGARPGQLG
jgi:dihydroflavonol-4-reductase